MAENGRTIAVLGSGLQAIHPRQNISLAKQIIRQGAVISEYKPQTRVKGSQLMARDRIVSGLSLAVIVIQANGKSGTLDTARKHVNKGACFSPFLAAPVLTCSSTKGLMHLIQTKLIMMRL